MLRLHTSVTNVEFVYAYNLSVKYIKSQTDTESDYVLTGQTT